MFVSNEVALCLAVVAVAVGMGVWALAEGPGGSEKAMAVTTLPPVKTTGGMSLAEALQNRRSQRKFSDKALSQEQLGQLCWAAQGITDERRGYRSSPSAGALFPMTLWVADAQGLYEYVPQGHVLRLVRQGDIRDKLAQGCYGQGCVKQAALVMVIAMDTSIIARKYAGKAEMYCLLEAGHIGQNILLQATALGLGAVPVGAFEEAKVNTVLALPKELRTAYIVPVGNSG